MAGCETFSTEGIKQIRQNLSGPADHLLSKYFTFSGKGQKGYKGLRP